MSSRETADMFAVDPKVILRKQREAALRKTEACVEALAKIHIEYDRKQDELLNKIVQLEQQEQAKLGKLNWLEDSLSRCTKDLKKLETKKKGFFQGLFGGGGKK